MSQTDTTEALDAKELLPCPFCGGKALAYHAFPQFEEGWHIDCEHDATCILRVAHGMFACEATEDLAIASWNRRAATSAGEASEPVGHVDIAHDGFSGDIIGHYVTREGKRGVVVQQDETRVVHVYGEKWLSATPALAAPVTAPPQPAPTYEPTEIHYEDGGYVEFVNEDVPYIVRDLNGPAAAILDMETRRVIGYRVYDAQPGPRADLVERFTAILALPLPNDHHDLTPEIALAVVEKYKTAIRQAIAALSAVPRVEGDTCDCERGHNGIGMAGRKCDCPAGGHPEDGWTDEQHGAAEFALTGGMSLATRIALLGQGACDCNTKSPDVHMHLPICRYRRALELADEAEVVSELLSEAEAFIANLSGGGETEFRARLRREV